MLGLNILLLFLTISSSAINTVPLIINLAHFTRRSLLSILRYSNNIISCFIILIYIIEYSQDRIVDTKILYYLVCTELTLIVMTNINIRYDSIYLSSLLLILASLFVTTIIANFADYLVQIIYMIFLSCSLLISIAINSVSLNAMIRLCVIILDVSLAVSGIVRLFISNDILLSILQIVISIKSLLCGLISIIDRFTPSKSKYATKPVTFNFDNTKSQGLNNVTPSNLALESVFSPRTPTRLLTTPKQYSPNKSSTKLNTIVNTKVSNANTLLTVPDVALSVNPVEPSGQLT